MAGARDVPSSRTVARAIGRRLSQTEADDQPPSSVAGGTRFISYHSSAPALRRTTSTGLQQTLPWSATGGTEWERGSPLRGKTNYSDQGPWALPADGGLRRASPAAEAARHQPQTEFQPSVLRPGSATEVRSPARAPASAGSRSAGRSHRSPPAPAAAARPRSSRSPPAEEPAEEQPRPSRRGRRRASTSTPRRRRRRRSGDSTPAGHASAHDRVQDALRTPPSPPPSPATPPPSHAGQVSGAGDEPGIGCQLHVRGVGGKFEDEKALSRVFGRFGEVIQATVRHRIDDSGANTSWALVTMASVGAVEDALAAAESLPKPITVTRFSQKQASASKGAMGSIQKEAAAKQMSVLHVSDISVRAMRRRGRGGYPYVVLALGAERQETAPYRVGSADTDTARWGEHLTFEVKVRLPPLLYLVTWIFLVLYVS